MAESWNHELVYHEQSLQTRCSVGKCLGEHPKYLATYRYITGRAGRASTSTRMLCDKHAIAFAAKHSVPLPVVLVEVAGRPKPMSSENDPIRKAAIRILVRWGRADAKLNECVEDIEQVIRAALPSPAGEQRYLEAVEAHDAACGEALRLHEALEFARSLFDRDGIKALRGEAYTDTDIARIDESLKSLDAAPAAGPRAWTYEASVTSGGDIWSDWGWVVSANKPTGKDTRYRIRNLTPLYAAPPVLPAALREKLDTEWAAGYLQMIAAGIDKIPFADRPAELVAAASAERVREIAAALVGNSGETK